MINSNDLSTSDISIIESHLQKQVLDLRIRNDARWIDQKVQYDNLYYIITDAILHGFKIKKFTAPEIRKYKHYEKTIIDLYGKPRFNKLSSNEYDKFVSQPLKTLAYFGILTETKEYKTNVYDIAQTQILEMMSRTPGTTLKILVLFFEEMISQNNWTFIEDFWNNNDSDQEYQICKNSFREEMIKYTKLGSRGSDGKLETGRMFTPFINPLANKRKKRGTLRGHLSPDIIQLDELSYNRINFRDQLSGKAKSQTRKSYDPPDPLPKAIMTKMKILRKSFAKSKNTSKSYVSLYSGKKERGMPVHHIFTVAQCPDLACVLENLVPITYQEHQEAHGGHGGTRSVDSKMQKELLIVQAGFIEDHEIHDGKDFSKDIFIKTLKHGLLKTYNITHQFTFDMNWHKIKTEIEFVYDSII